VTQFHERLRKAIFSKYEGVEEAASDMNVTGASYPNLLRILRGDSKRPPSVAFVQAIAERLDVRPSWLAFGHGAMTEKEERARQTTENVAERFDETLHRARQGVLDGLGIPTEEEAAEMDGDGMKQWEARIASHRAEALRLSVLPALALVEQKGMTPRQIGEMIRADFDAMGREPTTMTPEELDDYLLVRFGAMLSAISYPRSSVIW